MSRPFRIVVTQRNFDDLAKAYLAGNGCECVVIDVPPGQADIAFTHDELVDILAGADGWIVGFARVTRELLLALPDLKVISRRGVGYERVDTAAATELGRVVVIAAGGNDGAVADHTIAVMIVIGRRLREMQANMAKGNWSILPAAGLHRKTVGIVGLGRIGRSLVRRLKGFETTILVTAPRQDQAYAEEHGIRYVALPELLAESDFVSLHAPLTPETRFLINRDTIALMKPSAILVNTARGGLVEDAHLLEALEQGRLAGAALDLYVSELDPAYQAVTEKLIALPNVIATPHSAASTIDSLYLMNRIASESVVAVLKGGSPPPERVVADGRRRQGLVF